MSSPPIDGSVVMVTGASSGIGSELARLLARRARLLLLVARRADRLLALAEELAEEGAASVQVLACDLGDRAALEAMVSTVEAQHGGVDVLINNAGRGDFSVFDLSEWERKEEIIELNIRALTYLTQRLVPGMVSRRRGGVLMISSGAGLMPLPGMATYVGSKHYVTGFSDSLRMELASTAVVVTQVCPGPVETEFMAVAGASEAERPPGFLSLSARRCAELSLRGFERNRAMVLPGLMNKLSVWMGLLMPRFMLRLALGPMARSMRRRQALPGGGDAPGAS